MKTWPWQRALEFLLIGGLTPVLYVFSFVMRAWLGLDAAEYAVGFSMFHAAHLLNDPHFGVTYCIFYEDFRGRAFGAAFPKSLRIRYWLCGIIAPLLIALWMVTALYMHSAQMLGALIQLMFLLVGFHYVKQGFGVMILLSARRQVAYAPRERFAILAHALAGWAYAWASPADPGSLAEEKGVVFRTWVRSVRVEQLARGTFAASTLYLAFILLRKWRRERRLPITTPLTALLCSVWAWTLYSEIDPLVRYVTPALHSVQYLVMVHLLKHNEGKAREGPPHFEMSKNARLGLLAATALTLGFLLFHGVPHTLDALLVAKQARFTDLGPTPYFAAIYAWVNLHHYLMDMAIWRKENPKMRYLIAGRAGQRSGARDADCEESSGASDAP
jgi:hypothetical protein